MIESIWNYRYFIFSAIKNDLNSRFAQSKLGALWAIFNPLAQVLIYALILSNVLAAKLPGIDNKYGFAIYLMAGTLGWALFAEIITRSLNLFVQNANLLKKINFPRATLPIIMLGSCLVNNLVLFTVIFIIFAILAHPFSVELLWLLPLTATVVLFAFGIGLILGIINVFIRDVSQIVPIVLQVMFWFTPIVYPVSIIPEQYLTWLHLNPMFHLIEAYHSVLVYNQAPEFGHFLILGLLGLSITLLGTFMFRRASPEMADVL